MDKDLELKKDIEEKPVDEMGDLDEQFEDLIWAAEHSEKQRQRFALVVDATSSMSGVWSMAKDALKSAVDEIKSRSNVPIQIQVVAYRDHTDDPADQVVQASEWSDDTDYLKNYINRMYCHGGGDYPESIGHGLQFIKQQQERTHQIILIGDAPSKQGSYGYAEAQYFGRQQTPIYALYTNEAVSLVECFNKLAALSGGKAFYLGNLEAMDDVFKVIIASNKALQIEYQPMTLEGKKLLEELKR